MIIQYYDTQYQLGLHFYFA